MRTLKVGVVGVGYLGRFHAQKYAAINDVELVGVADIDHGQAQSAASKFGCRAFADYRELIGRVGEHRGPHSGSLQRES